MLTLRLIHIIRLCVLLLILHGLEEIYGGFYEVYPFFTTVGHLFSSRAEAVFIGSQVTVWLLLILLYLMLLSEAWRFRIVLLFGAVILYENQHLYHVIIDRRYYPGAVTASVLLVLSVLFWHEVYTIVRNAYERRRATRVQQQTISKQSAITNGARQCPETSPLPPQTLGSK